MQGLTIGKLAKQAQVNTITIRYYERCGLIPDSKRSAGGYRLYPEHIVAQLRFIRNAKAVGFSLEEIKELLALKHHPRGTSQRVKNFALKKLAEIKDKISALQKMQYALEHMAGSCDGKMPVHDCPVLSALYSEAEVCSNAKKS